MRESAIESWSKKRAKDCGWYVRKFKAPGNNAVPDDIFIKHSHVFFVEFKATGKDATDLQKDEHGEIRDHGCHVHVCDSREHFERILQVEELYAVE